MNKLLIVGLLLATAPALAKKSVNPNVEGRSTEECSVHGCSLVCKGPSTKSYVRVSKIDKAEIILMKSGTMIFDLKRFKGDMKVVIPEGTESCSLRNIS
ncbi:hypothetical protein AB4186_23615 [Vibrio lentus]